MDGYDDRWLWMTQVIDKQMIRDRRTPYLCPCTNTHYPPLPAEPSNAISSAVFIQHAGLLFLLRGEEEHKWAYYYSSANLSPQCKKQSPTHCQLMFKGGRLFVPENYIFICAKALYISISYRRLKETSLLKFLTQYIYQYVYIS